MASDRQAIATVAIGTLVYLGAGLWAPFWPLIAASAICVVALVGMLRARGKQQLAVTVWTRIAAIAPMIGLVAFAVVDAITSGPTLSHLAVVSVAVVVSLGMLFVRRPG